MVLLVELRERGYTGGYTVPKDYPQPKRETAWMTAVRRFETPPGRQAQVDSAHLGTLKIRGKENKPSGFTFALGNSRIMMMEQRWTRNWALWWGSPKRRFGNSVVYPEEILYDRMKTVWVDVDERGEIIWSPRGHSR
ncbi:MAG TPA: hypothetical protein VK513_13390 [Terriglobales bacterium]|nr:hypothetical protein [Terriglobales bacterium]